MCFVVTPSRICSSANGVGALPQAAQAVWAVITARVQESDPWALPMALVRCPWLRCGWENSVPATVTGAMGPLRLVTVLLLVAAASASVLAAQALTLKLRPCTHLPLAGP